MSTVFATVDQQTRPGRRERRTTLRFLRRQDLLSARPARPHGIPGVLEQAAEVVSGGWVQNAWFSVAMPGGTRDVTAYDLHLVLDHPVTGACLVGAVVHAGGGPAEVRSQLVQRTLDVTWHALGEDPHQPVQWCPAPP